MLSALLALLERESVALTVKLLVAIAVGAPLITPVLAFSDTPAGNDPKVTDQVYGAVPPLTASVALYGDLKNPSGNDAVVTVGGATVVVMLRAFAAMCAAKSATRT